MLIDSVSKDNQAIFLGYLKVIHVSSESYLSHQYTPNTHPITDKKLKQVEYTLINF